MDTWRKFLARDLDHQKLSICYNLRLTDSFKGCHADFKKERWKFLIHLIQ